MITQLAATLAALSLWPGTYAMRSVTKSSGNDTAGGNTTTSNPFAACQLYAHMNVPLSSGWEPLFDCVPSTGTIQGFMIFVDFADANGTAPQTVYDSLMPHSDEWFMTSSYGQLSLNITADTTQYYRMSKPTTAYDWAGFSSADKHTAYIQDALDTYMQAHPAEANPFPEADVIYIMTPPSAQSFYNSLTTTSKPTTRSGQVVARKATTGGMDMHGTNGYRAFVHETGHTMCLADYYPTDQLNTAGYYVAGFSIMADITQQTPDHFAWDKWRMGWMPDTSVSCVSEKGSSTHVLSPLENSPGQGTQAVVVAVSDTKALVAEARTRNALDEGICAEGSGVLLYTVDTQVSSGNGPIRVLYNAPDRYTCNGYPMNRAPLSFGEGRSSTLTVEEFGVTVTLMEAEAEERFTVKVDYV
jgi:M6 family metalloprotease-like protein